MSDMAAHRVAARITFPLDGDRDLVPLYIDQNQSDRSAGRRLDPRNFLSRRSLKVDAGDIVSLGSYFNAFPAAYWQRWTVVREVRLEVITSGSGSVVVYRSAVGGYQQRVATHRVSGDHHRLLVDLPLNAFGDGGWYWFDLSAEASDLVLEEAAWWVPTAGARRGSVTIATTTMDKTDYIIGNLNILADSPELMEVIDDIVVVDHGRNKVVEAEGYAALKERLGDRLDIIEQPNLGGSGGFARGQYEAVTRGCSDYVILMDDDISIEPETLVRMATFADMCKKPTLVGGHMFDLLNRPQLHTFGEVVDPQKWVWTTQRSDQYLSHNFSVRGLRETKWMHTRVDVDYNAWWCCLIPTEVVRKIGLGLPLFIKWDDVEYGIRARDAGYRTVSLPGAAVWHVGWVGKDDRVGWQAYFHARNRLIAALLHSPVKRGGDLLRNAEINDLTHLVSMQYYTVAGRLKGAEDVLAGPEQLHELLPVRLGEIRAMAADYDDSTIKPSPDDFPAAPPVRLGKPFRPRHQAGTDLGIQRDLDADEFHQKSYRELGIIGIKALLRQLKRVPDEAYERPLTAVDHPNKQWWQLAQLDSAIVTNAEGSGFSWYRRQPALVKQMMARSMRNYAEIWRRWDELAARYRAAMPELTSFESWERTFGIEHREIPDRANTRVEVG